MGTSAAAKRIGLIAGWGRYPVLVAEKLTARGFEVCCIGIKGHADPSLQASCAHYRASSLARMADHIRFFRRHAVQRATFAGKIHKTLFFQPNFLWQNLPDWACFRCFFHHFVSGKRDRQDDTLLSAAVGGYRRGGIEIVPATDLVPELLVERLPLGRGRLSRRQWTDIQFGWRLAKAMGDLDVGQSVAVKGQAVLAVEAVEGTDACIRRAGELCPAGGFVVVKVAKPSQDMRFDVPTIGLGTLQTLHAAGGRVLAIEAGRTILLDEAAVKAFAAAHQISIVTLQDADLQAQAAA
jgi:DUF1009 family protein